MSKSAKIPTIGGGRENYARVRKLDNLNSNKTVKLRRLLIDEVGFIDSSASFLINSKIMFDGEFDLDCLTTSIPNKTLFDEDFTEHWDFEETFNLIIAEKAKERIAEK
jgi:siroheme synthase (precorrin-2 oxidase/ferrochelatase)